MKGNKKMNKALKAACNTNRQIYENVLQFLPGQIKWQWSGASENYVKKLKFLLTISLHYAIVEKIFMRRHDAMISAFISSVVVVLVGVIVLVVDNANMRCAAK